MNWSFPEATVAESSEESLGDADTEIPVVALDSEGDELCVANEVLVTFDGGVDERGLREALADSGVDVADVSLVSKSLDGGEVLTRVSYEGDEDPDEVVDILSDNALVTSAEPNYLLELDDVEASSVPSESFAAANCVWSGVIESKVAGSVVSEQYVERPRAIEGLVYDGKTQLGVPESKAYELSGDFEAVDAGSYVAVATLNSGYHWSEGGDDPASIEWEIARQPIGLDLASPTYDGEVHSALEGGSSLEVDASVLFLWGDRGRIILSKGDFHSYP